MIQQLPGDAQCVAQAGPLMEPRRKLAVAHALQRYCNARNAACIDVLSELFAEHVSFDSQRFTAPVVGRAAVVAHLTLGWQYLRALADPLDGGSYRVREVSLSEAADVPCGVLYRKGRDEHLCVVEPDEEGRIERVRLLYFPDPALNRPLWLGIQPAGVMRRRHGSRDALAQLQD